MRISFIAAAILGLVACVGQEEPEIAVSSSALDSGDQIAVVATDTGWYGTSSHVHNANVKTFLVGPLSGDFHNYFVFDLSGVTERVQSARLIASNNCSAGIGGTLSLYDVTTPAATVMASHNDGSQHPIFDDLGAGEVLATVSILDPKATPIELAFNHAGVAAVDAARGGLFVVGGAYVTQPGGYVMGCTNSPTQAQLVVTVGGDSEPPAISVPGPITVEATGPDGAVVNYVVTATDDVDGDVAVACTPASGAVFPLGTTAVSCTAHDATGNTSLVGFLVTVTDATAPALTLPGDLAEVAGPGGVVVEFEATATDAVDGDVPVTCSPASGSVFPLGDTVVTCTASDAAGNTATGTFTVSTQYEFGGFECPIANDGSSDFNRGRTVPVKFALGGASAGISDLAARLYLAPITSAGVGDAIPATSTSCQDDADGNLFRYNPWRDDYELQLSTRSLAVGRWLLIVDLGDGAEHTVEITLHY